MKKILLSILITFISFTAFSQSCLPEGITFTTQEQIDSFQINYPGCTEIEGGVVIGGSAWGSDITNLNGLNILTSIAGNLSISFVGLSNLIGLNNITSIGGLSIQYTHLKSLEGLNNITSIDGQLFIKYNDSLQSISALSHVNTIGGYFNIVSNINLTTLNGLENIEANSMTSLYIFNNTLLASCEVQSICDHLAAPSGIVSIFNNAPGCNSPEEVEEACLTFVEETNGTIEYSIYPNPVKDMATFSTDEIVSFELYDLMGARIIRRNSNKIDMSYLDPGIYFVIGFDKHNNPLYKGKIIKK